jgi:alpha-tubulin suppressor-like RCC1 family protein
LLLKIAAGGWHSAAISEFDDLYMFGWNESGQLALPTNLARDGTLPIKQTELAHT